jgi:hypothetical protein
VPLVGRTGRRRGIAAGAVLALAVALLGVGAPSNAAVAADPLVYASLGDSYVSGPLVGPFDASRVPIDCGQSSVNFAHLAAKRLGAELRDVSCGGATIDKLFEAQGPLPSGGTNPPQLSALGPDVDVVTLGLGGNDVGSVGLALDCVRLLPQPLEQPCTPGDAGQGDAVSRDIADMQAELTEALGAVQAAAPNAEVLVVSYPTSLPDDGVACWPYVPILPADMPYLVGKFKEMNAALQAAANAAGATYVDIYTPSIGHDACKLPLVAWVSGMVLVPPGIPAHPNALSYLHSAPVVAAAITAAVAGP